MIINKDENDNLYNYYKEEMFVRLFVVGNLRNDRTD